MVEDVVKEKQSRKVNVTLSISRELYEYAKSVPLNLSAILELALLRLYRNNVDYNYTTRYAYYLMGRFCAKEPEMLRLKMFFHDLKVYCA